VDDGWNWVGEVWMEGTKKGQDKSPFELRFSPQYFFVFQELADFQLGW